MISSYPDSLAVSNLPDIEGWKHQKERLLENVHNAIKRVQNHASGLEDMSTPLQMEDVAVQELCQQLDLIFLHGLRHIANGYWMFAREFTHKGTVDSVLELEHVHTNVGRGRAWLFLTLNENALESYIRSFTTNLSVTDRYYIQQAFLRDGQRLQMLNTMVAGLEFVSFRLEVDCLFLDQTILPANGDKTVFLRKDASLSSISLSSSIISQGVKLTREVYWNYVPYVKYLVRQKKQSSASLDSPTTSQDGDSGFGTMDTSQLNGSENPLSVAVRQRVNGHLDEHIARILKMNFAEESSDVKSEDGLESVQVLRQSIRRRKKNKNGIRSQPVIVLQDMNGDDSCSEVDVTPSPDTTPTYDGAKNCGKFPANAELSTSYGSELKKSLTSQQKIGDVNVGPCLDGSKPHSLPKCVTNGFSEMLVEVKPAIVFREKAGERKNPTKRVSFEIDLVANDVNMNFYANSSSDSSSVETPSFPSLDIGAVNGGDSTVVESAKVRVCGDGIDATETITLPTNYDSTKLTPAEDKTDGKIECSIYDRNPVSCIHRKLKPKKAIGIKGLTLKLNEMEINQQSRKFDEKIRAEIKEKWNNGGDVHHIRVDNNTLLKLIISVFRDNEEKLFKMYHATVGHSEDKLKILFIVLTDRRLYLIEHGLCQRRFFISKVIHYEEIDYLLLGLNYQTILITCKRRRKRYMLCTGDESLTKSIISNLEVAVRRWCGMNRVPSVFTDSDMQSIGLKKWLANETNIERHEVCLLHYVLVHWEDPMAPSSPQCPAGPSKDGHLMFRTIVRDLTSKTRTETMWSPGYFVLRAGVLYQFNEQGSHELKTYTRLHTPDFRGCRRIACKVRPHVFELLLAPGRTMLLAAADDYEASEWMQALLQTISQKSMDENPRPFKACCLVLTPEKLFVCQEDLELYTCVTLGCASLVDLLKVQVDSCEPKYCILEFESLEANVCGGDWVLYFNSEGELQKFFEALDGAYQHLLKISLEKTEVTDSSILSKCRDRVQVLLSSWQLGYEMLNDPMAIIECYTSPQ